MLGLMLCAIARADPLENVPFQASISACHISLQLTSCSYYRMATGEKGRPFDPYQFRRAARLDHNEDAAQACHAFIRVLVHGP